MTSVVFRATRRFWRELGSGLRIWSLKRQYPGLVTVGRVRISRGCDIYVARDSQLIIRDCALAPGVTLTTAAGAVLDIAADFIGPGSVVVARTYVRIGEGSKVAERVTIRDANHDRSVPLSAQAFKTAPVAIGRNVWVAAGCAILAGVTVGDDATVAAGAVVTRDVAMGHTVAGVPARSISGIS